LAAAAAAAVALLPDCGDFCSAMGIVACG